MQAMSRSLSTRLIPVTKTCTSKAAMMMSSQATGAGDPKVHSGDPPGEAPSDDYPQMAAKFSATEAAEEEHGKGYLSRHAMAESVLVMSDAKERVPPFAPSGKLESHEVTSGSEGPDFQQKRRVSGYAKRDAHEVEDDRKYYKDHKPSPLSNIEFVDTRKPFGKASDGPASEREVEGGESQGVMMDDTVDAALERAERMFREAATRGVPEWPHSRALAKMLRMREKQGGGDGADMGYA